MDVSKWLSDNDIKTIKDYVEKVDLQIYLQNKELIIQTMKQIEKLHWFYIDNLQKKFNFERVGFKKFIEYLFYGKNVPTSYKKYIKKYISIYSQYKRALPRFGTIIRFNNEYLMVKNIGSNVYGFPKGKVENNEADYQTAIRETFEETGINISSIIDVSKFTIIYDVKYFLIDLNNKINFNKLPFDYNEIYDRKWVKLPTLDKNILSSHAKVFMKILSI